MTLCSTCMQHGIPQSLIVFAVSCTLETRHFDTFDGVAHPLENFLIFNLSSILNMYMHISEILFNFTL